MKNKKNPADFLGAKVLSAVDSSKVQGGMGKTEEYCPPCTGQYQGQCQCPMQQQQEIQNAF